VTRLPSIRLYLVRTGRTIKRSAVMSGILWWLTMSLGVWLVLFLLDNLLDLPSAIRFPLAAGGGLFLLAGFVRKVAVPALGGVNAERTAMALEQVQRVEDNLLINACQLETQELAPGEQMFASRTLDRSSTVLSSLPVSEFWKRGVLMTWGLATAGLAILWIAYSLIFPRQVVNALARYILPLGDIPPAGSISLVVHPSADIVINEGADLGVSAMVDLHGQAPGPDSMPYIVWAEGQRPVDPVRRAGETAPMQVRDTPGQYDYTFRSVQRSFSFRVLAADTYSRHVLVTVVPKPGIMASVFRIQPPAYTALPLREGAGPPAPVSGLPLSTLEVRMAFDQPLASVMWSGSRTNVAFVREGNLWTTDAGIIHTGPYTITTRSVRNGLPAIVATGEVQLETDHAPEVGFVADNLNLFVAPGTVLSLAVRASDDFGMHTLVVICRSGGGLTGAADQRPIKEWRYAGPPGNPGPVRESFSLTVDPRTFVPGETYLLEALSTDFRPDSEPGKSKPVVIRVKAIADLTVPEGDVLANAMNLLKQTIAEQKRANELADNLRTHREEAIGNQRVGAHGDSMKKQQENARSIGRKTRAELLKFPAEARSFSDRLSVLVEHEMGLALQQIAGIGGLPTPELPERLDRIIDRQTYILNELIALLGTVSNARVNKDPARENNRGKEVVLPPALRDDTAASLADDLGAFERAQKQIIKANQSLLDKQPEDLTRDEKEEIAGALAREEAEWAKFLEEKLTDWARLPLQDFGDGSVAQQLNEVIQDVDKAAAALYEKKIEMAVPLEQSGLEKAEALVQNLEKWLSNTPDHVKWSMEEPANQADIPMAELPAELEDIVGELLDQETEMEPDIEDVSSSWLDSMDKGAGWDAADGPISSMSAKGVTGNLLPNQQEIGGRSGEGRSGKSHGQMVQDSAEGKGGRETPTRLSPSPFEPGHVQDSSTMDSGGATGGGKLSGFGEAGLRGPTPPPPPEKMARIAGSQAQIRQQAEALALKLRKYKLPSGDVEASVTAMRNVEEAARSQDGLRVRRSYHTAIDALQEARKDIRAEVGLHRERALLPESAVREIMMGLQDGMPKGYEELVADYFRRMAGDTR